jgi:hypothetical protein
MSKTDKSVTITISIDKDVKKSLEKFAQETDLTVSRLSRNLIYESLYHFRLLDKVNLGNQMLPIKLGHFRKSMNEYASTINQPLTINDKFDQIQISVIVNEEIKNTMDIYSKSLNMPLKMFASNMLYIGLNDFKLLNKIGIIKIAIAFEKFITAFKNFRPENYK